MTIGYEGRTPAEFIASLKEAAVEVLLDVRIRPQSRKAGFSKTALGNLCRENGINYIHERSLGTPESIMADLRATGVYDWDSYKKHLLSETEGLDRAVSLASEQVVCLMCYEAKAETCHRQIIASEIASRLKLNVRNL